MIRKILYLSILLIMTAATARSQSFTVTPTDTLVLDTTVTSCNSESILKFSLYNNSIDTLAMNWRVVYGTFPHGWTVAFCDPNVCLSSTQIGAQTFHFKMVPGSTGLMQLDLTPVSGSACGNYQVLTWVTNDSANTAAYLNFKTCITCTSSGISETEVSQISFYPNPVHSQLNISLPQNLSNGQIDIYNLIGSKVFSRSISNRENIKDIDLSGLETGIYMARITDGGKIVATKKFTKTE